MNLRHQIKIFLEVCKSALTYLILLIGKGLLRNKLTGKALIETIPSHALKSGGYRLFLRLKCWEVPVLLIHTQILGNEVC